MTLQAYRVGDGRLPLMAGEGAALYGGRWNSPGRRVVYASADLATSMLEYLAASNGIVSRHSVWLELVIPDVVSRESVSSTDVEGWDADPPYASRAFGDRWLQELRSAVLIVPSVVVPSSRNVVLNPAHEDFSRIKSGRPNPLAWDRRLVRHPKPN